MIDMTFQLIAFFMVLINFSEVEYDQEIHLPSSELAKPPDRPLDNPLTIHLTERGSVKFSGEEVDLSGLQNLLRIERRVLERIARTDISQVTIVIRADADSPTGLVQEIIQLCQQMNFEKFSLKARQKTSGIPTTLSR